MRYKTLGHTRINRQATSPPMKPRPFSIFIVRRTNCSLSISLACLPRHRHRLFSNAVQTRVRLQAIIICYLSISEDKPFIQCSGPGRIWLKNDEGDQSGAYRVQNNEEIDKNDRTVRGYRKEAQRQTRIPPPAHNTSERCEPDHGCFRSINSQTVGIRGIDRSRGPEVTKIVEASALDVRRR